jgi:hypothetical protein
MFFPSGVCWWGKGRECLSNPGCFCAILGCHDSYSKDYIPGKDFEKYRNPQKAGCMFAGLLYFCLLIIKSNPFEFHET